MRVKVQLDFYEFVNLLERKISENCSGRVKLIYWDNIDITPEYGSIPEESIFQRYINYAKRKGTLKNIHDYIDPLAATILIEDKVVTDGETVLRVIGAYFTAGLSELFIRGSGGGGKYVVAKFRIFDLTTTKFLAWGELKELNQNFREFEIWSWYNNEHAKYLTNCGWDAIEEALKKI